MQKEPSPMHLLNRLTTIADMVIKNKVVADIGSDHALLPIYMLENQLVTKAIVTDVIDGPYERAKKAVGESPYPDKIEVRKGDGLDIIKPHEVQTIIIAGMGGDTIVDIISRDFLKAETYERFILQPMSRPYVVRELLAKRGWTLNEERLVYENNRFFVILSYTPSNNPYNLTPLQLDIGSLLLENNYKYKLEYLRHYLTKYKNIYNKLANSKGAKEQELLKEYYAKIRELEDIINEIN